MHIKKMKNGWGFRVDIGSDPVTGKRKQCSRSGFPTKKAAKEALESLLSNHTDSEPSDNTESATASKEVIPSLTVSEFITDWFHNTHRNQTQETTFYSHRFAIPHIVDY